MSDYDCPLGSEGTLPCPHCQPGCKHFSTDTQPKGLCGSNGFLPCVGCDPHCGWASRRVLIDDAVRSGRWRNGTPYAEDPSGMPRDFDVEAVFGPAPVEPIVVLPDDPSVEKPEERPPSLSDAQRLVVEHERGPALVISGAGSGKTHTLTSRICELVYKGLARPSQILALTFTKKAANEMRERIRKRLKASADEIVLSTFHSLALSLCRDNPGFAGRDRGFSVWDEDASAVEMRRILREMKSEEGQEVDFSEYDALARIDKRRESGLDVDELFLSEISDLKMIKAISAYEAAKRSSNAMDFADLVFSAVRMLRRYDGLREEIHKRWRFILVDEYQDTNDLQEQFLGLLLGPEKNLMAVGDEDQSIYAFRGSNVAHILTFPDRYEGCKIYHLGQNYRSQGLVVKAASNLIEFNDMRRRKDIFTQIPSGFGIGYHGFRTQEDEAAAIAAAVRSSSDLGRSYRDHAVLVRTRRQFIHIRKALSKSSIPYVVVGDVSLYQRADVRLVLSWLSAIINGRDVYAGATCLSSWPLLGATLVEAWKKSLDNAEGSMFSRLETLLSLPRMGAHTKRGKSLLLFIEAWNEIMRRYKNGDSILEICTWLYSVTGIDAEIKELGDPSREDTFDEEQFDARTELKERFFLAIRSISDEMNFDMGAYERLSFFIDSIYMQSSKDRKDVDRVVLSTVHSAKGLEWDWVWVAGCCEGIFPFIPSADKIDVEGGAPSFDVFDDRGVTDDEMQIEEERRLMYVAVTRARRELSISWFSSMRAPGGVGIVPREKSRFVNEVQLSRPELRIQQSRDMLAQARGIVACVSEKNPYFVFSTTTLSDMEFHLANAEVSFDKKDHDALFASYEEIKDRLFELKMRTTPKIRVIAPPISVSTN